MSLHPNEVLLAPVVSEKSYSLIEDRKYSFRVHKDAHKTQVRQAVEQLFGVKVVAVNIVKVPPKPKMRNYVKGRAFARPSGTEDVVRVYAEAYSRPEVEKLATHVARIVKDHGTDPKTRPEYLYMPQQKQQQQQK